MTGLTWLDYTVGTDIPLTNIGDKVSFRGTTTVFSEYFSDYYYFKMTGNIKAYGSVDSLINYSDLTDYCYYNMFSNCKSLIDVSQLQLPAIKLAYYCYYNMFSNCKSLITAPQLPAVNLAGSCYEAMFYRLYKFNYCSLATCYEFI